MKNTVFVSKLKDIAENYQTLYVLGCFGAPMNQANKARYMDHMPWNASPSRKPFIENATSDTFGFDCVCLIKGILWGWVGDKNHLYGGAVYGANGVPDIDTETMISMCEEVSMDFSKIEIGELLWMQGHVGVYIGDGLAVECTPNWENKVQITAVSNIGNKKGYYSRNWVKHGKLPWVQYPANDKRSLKENLEILQKSGIINTPSYWENMTESVKYLDELIANMANYIISK